jgi:formate dehydrogenase major subunit
VLLLLLLVGNGEGRRGKRRGRRVRARGQVRGRHRKAVRGHLGLPLEICQSASPEQRVCLVEIQGRKGYPAACTTLVEPGMVVTTQSPRLHELRKGVVELYLSDFPKEDVPGGWSELHETLQQVGVAGHPYGQGENHLQAPVDDSNPYFLFDPAKCIVCSRCVRACEDIQGTFALTIQGRGFGSQVAASQGERFLDSECVSCGACVQACPTHSLVEKSLFEGGYQRAQPPKA